MFTSRRSKGQHTSPITLLDDDMLWLILLKNTEVNNDKRLTTARYGSQVCRRWRQLMLGSPFIWGRLLDINSFPTKTSNWIQEVMSRSGEAPLWITGSRDIFARLERRSPDFPGFVLTFFKDNWARVEKLDISDDLRTRSEGRDRKRYWRYLFSRPAPLLKEFSFRYSDFDEDKWHAPSPWFHSLAPSVKRFCVRGFGNTYDIHTIAPFSIGMPSSWLSRLRSLTLYQRMDLSGVLKVLQMVPLLEELELTTFSNSGNVNQSQHILVCLPRLSTLRLRGWDDISNVGRLLDSISPSDNCCLSMSAPPDPRTPDTPTSDPGSFNPILELGEVKRGQSVLLRYTQNYNEARPIIELSLSCGTHFIEVIGKIPSGLSIFIPRTTDDSWLLSMLFEPSVFNSVHTLSIAQGTLESLVMYADQGYQESFPRLHTLKIDGEQKLDPEYGALLYQFLKKRQKISRPISVLDLSKLNLNCFTRDFDDLEEFFGLTVALPKTQPSRREDTYVCGSGFPELLRFNEQRQAQSRRSSGLCRFNSPGFRHKYVTYGWSGYV
ncbi:hypothetical protein D9613_006200 [Agrocybe pediades]|uniref:F-box domain-containing protein n=1 Tax=Agrocybe pediades TaxID=84607 RepID=A0A8H4VR33_9AGAR|nr:hypothetical protein D9613_006200 [Agrocybe pediades]